MKEKKCKHNWHYVGTETFNRSIKGVKQFATFICDVCGKTKVIEVDGYLNKEVCNR